MIIDARDSILLTWSKSSSSLVLSTQLPNGSPFFNLYVYLIYTVLESQGSVQWLSHVWLCDPMDCSTPGFPVHHQLPELTQTHVHGVGDAIQPSHPLSAPSPSAFNLSQHQDLSQWVSSLHHVAKVTFYKCKRGRATAKLDALCDYSFYSGCVPSSFSVPTVQPCMVGSLHLQTPLCHQSLCALRYFHAGFQVLILINSF